MNENNNKTSENHSTADRQSHHYDDRSTLSTLSILKQIRTQTAKIFNFLFRTFHSAVGLFQSDTQEGGTVTDDIRRAFSNLNRLNTAVGGGLLLMIIYLLSGIFVVNPGEQAVVKLFGKPVNKGVGEGMHYRMPWPFQAVDIVNVSTIRREGIGLVLPEHQSIHSSPRVIQFLTGDSNIIDIQAVAQYRIKDASAYLYNVNYPAYQLINEIIRSAITEIGGGMRVDDILTIGKERLQELIRNKAQELLDRYRSGLQLVGINLNKVYPPDDVAEAFRDVSNANQDREKRINDAWGYRNTVIPQARGDAVKIIREAEAFKILAINKASGEANRFEKMLTEYETDRQKYTTDVTVTRLYLESMEKVLARVKKYIVDPGKGGNINLRLLQK
jgi:membrane protease subunit HflK